MIENRTELNLGAELSKQEVIDIVDEWRYFLGFGADEIDTERPWGAFWRIPNWQVTHFAKRFFPGVPIDIEGFNVNLSPKLLLVAPNQQLSWQYHERRSENWKVLVGNLGVKLSETDKEPEEFAKLAPGQIVTIKKGERHRLLSLGEWGLVAEIWTHTDANKLSDEMDIKRLADNYGREN